MKKTLKGKAASNFVAVRFVDSDGVKALDKCAKGSPMYKAVEAELLHRGIELPNQN